MANVMYDPGREGFLDGSIDWDTHEFRAILVDLADYTFSAAHKFLSSVPAAARVKVSNALTTKTVTNGVADADDVTMTAVTGDPSEAIVIYQHALTQGGAALAEGAARLVCFIDTATGLPVTPNGGDVIIAWDNGANKIFKL